MEATTRRTVWYYTLPYVVLPPFQCCGSRESQASPYWGWEHAHLCGGRSALALCERVWTLITRFPGIPVQLGGSGALLAAYQPSESRIRYCRVQRSVQEIRV